MDEKLDLNGGVIIIGSLLWDKSGIRSKWRECELNSSENKLGPLPIRYGRISSSRHDTYTMVFSNDITPDKMGKGYVIPFKKNPINLMSELKEQAFKMIRAEKNEKEDKEYTQFS